MRRLLISFTLLVAVALTATGGATAQSAENGTQITIDTNGTAADDPEVGETITNDVRLISQEYSDGSLTFVLDSDRHVQATVVDIGRLSNGNPARERNIRLERGRNRIATEVESSGGQVGVTISIGGVIYPITERVGTTWIGGPWTAQDAQVAAIAGGTGVAVVVLVLTWREVSPSTGEDGERIA